MPLDDLSTSPSLLFNMIDPQNREEAWRHFLERYRPLLLAWCSRRQIPHVETEDLLSTVLFRLVKSLDSFQMEKRKGPGSFRAWLKKIVESVVVTAYREMKRRPGDYSSDQDRLERKMSLDVDPDVSDLADEIGNHIAGEEERARRAVNAVQARVEPVVWSAFYETAINGRTAAVVAVELGIPKGSIYVYTHRVRKMLRQEGERQVNDVNN